MLFLPSISKKYTRYMSIIQSMRDKGATILIAIIALSLIGFILMDARSGASRLFGGGGSTTLGSVNGDNIENADFNQRVKDMGQQYQNTDQVRQSVWDNMVAEKLLDQQFENLGIVFTPKEMSSIMFSEDAPSVLKQAFTDKQTGLYDIAKAQQWWAQAKKSRNEEQRRQINEQLIEPMQLNSLYTKYISMIGASIYIPAWLSKQQQEEKNRFANISYVAIPYSTISDSTVKVTDADITDYLDKNKAKYKQEGGRRISYVSFSEAPSSKDSLATKDALEAIKDNFKAD